MKPIREKRAENCSAVMKLKRVVQCRRFSVKWVAQHRAKSPTQLSSPGIAAKSPLRAVTDDTCLIPSPNAKSPETLFQISVLC